MGAFGRGIRHSSIVGLILLAGVFLAVPGTGQARQATPMAEDDPTWLVIQDFDTATLRPDPATGASTLVVSGVDATVLAFTDRPNRLVALVPTPDFVQAVTEAQADPLNASLVAPLDDGTAAVVVIELRTAVHDANAGTVTYQVTVLGAEERDLTAGVATPLAVPATELTFGAGHLFVDDTQVPVQVPVNVCGNSINVIGLLNPAFGNTCVSD
jgi:hypothetical protein